jgi:GTP-binding protein
MLEMKSVGSGKQRITFHVPSRALIGYHGEFLTDTRGTGVINRLFHGYAPHKGPIASRRNGTLISLGAGKAVAYALWKMEDRGPMFINPGDKVYTGMIIGEHSRGNDLDVNPLKGKQLTNIRSSGKDDAVDLTTPIEMGLDKAIAYITEDELVEVTPLSIRLRKRFLDIHERKRQGRNAEQA